MMINKPTNNKLVTSAYTYTENAVHSLNFLLEREGILNYGQMFDIKSALRSMKMVRALLKRTSFNHKDKYTRRMKND
jgi:hypothetical protein